MKQYFITISWNQPKNKAEKAAQDYIRQYQDCLVDEVSLDDLKKKMMTHADIINSEHKRCRDLKFQQWENHYDKDEFYYGMSASFDMTVRQVKRFELSDPDKHPVDDDKRQMKFPYMADVAAE